MDQVKGKSASEQNQGDGCNSDKKTADMTPFQTEGKFSISALNTAGLDSSLKVNVMPTESFEVPLMFRIVSQPFFQKLFFLYGVFLLEML